MRDLSRREFMAASGAAAALPSNQSQAARPASVRDPGSIAVASPNGLKAVARAFELMEKGEDPLVAAVAGVNLVEEDPNDSSVGYGGLPNEDGIVELDSSVMHGPSYRAGAVASLRNIMYPSKVALRVMERTDHVLLVGEGALRFARAHGFKEEDLLTDRARRRWLRWKEGLSASDDWLSPGEGAPAKKQADKEKRKEKQERQTGTIHLSARTAAGDFGSVTTTSGLAFKIPGRVGDSPIVGAGMYCENSAGSAGSTGRGEAVILSCGAHSIVELMGMGKHPKDACLEVCRRIATRTKQKHLLREDGRVSFNVNFYAINKKGEFGAACIWGPNRYAVATREGARHEEQAFLYSKR